MLSETKYIGAANMDVDTTPVLGQKSQPVRSEHYTENYVPGSGRDNSRFLFVDREMLVVNYVRNLVDQACGMTAIKVCGARECQIIRVARVEQ